MSVLFRLRCGFDLYSQREISGFLFCGACAGGHISLIKFLMIRAQINGYDVLTESGLISSIKHAYTSGNSDVIQLLARLGAFQPTPERSLSCIYNQIAIGIFAGGQYNLYLEYTIGFTDEERLHLESTYIHLAFRGCHETFIYNLLLFNGPEPVAPLSGLQADMCFKMAIYKGSENLVQLLLPTIKMYYRLMIGSLAMRGLDYLFFAFLDCAKTYGHTGILPVLNELISEFKIIPKKNDEYHLMDYFKGLDDH